MVDLTFLHAAEHILIDWGGVFAGWVLAYYPGRWAKRAIIKRWAVRR